MKYILLLLSLFLVTSVGWSQSPPVTYTLTIEYDPSFIASSILTIHLEPNACYAKLQVMTKQQNKDYRSSEKKSLKSADLGVLTNFFQTYHFRIRGSTDTIGSDKVFENGDSLVVAYHVVSGLDGIIVKGSLDQNGIIKKFQFWSPKNRDAKNQQLSETLLNIMQKAFIDKTSVEYIKALKTYF